jgi:hypothetical protein
VSVHGAMVFVVLGFEIRTSSLLGRTLPLEPLCQPLCWLWTTILISASWVPRITGVSHWHPDPGGMVLLSLCVAAVPWSPEERHEAHWSVVVHTYNHSYSGGKDQEDHGSKPAQANSSRDPSLKKSHHKKGLVEWLKSRPCDQAPVPQKKKKDMHPRRLCAE